MRSNGLLGKLAVAALIAFSSPNYARAESRAALFASGGTYIPPEQIGFGGMLFGGNIGLDVGNEKAGFRGQFSGFARKTTYHESFGYSGLREGEWDITSLLKMSAMLRLGGENANLSFGYFGAEADNTYKRLDRGFLNADVTSYSDKRRLHGPCAELNFSGGIGDDKRLFVTIGGDLIRETGSDKELKDSFAPYVCLGFEGVLK